MSPLDRSATDQQKKNNQSLLEVLNRRGLNHKKNSFLVTRKHIVKITHRQLKVLLILTNKKIER